MNKRNDTNSSDKDLASPLISENTSTDGILPAQNVSSTGYEDTLDNRELLRILSQVRSGNFSVRMPVDKTGLDGKICDTLNEIISLNDILMQELTKAGIEIGKKG